MPMIKTGFPVAKAGNNYAKRYYPDASDFTKKRIITDYSCGAEWGYMRGYEAAKRDLKRKE